jgi:uncharacterized protein
MTAETALSPVEPGYRHVLRIRLALFWVPVTIGAFILDRVLLRETAFGGVLAVAILLIALSVISAAPERIYRRLGYALHANLLQVVRGWLFHTDTLVPFVRVQHIDVTRGPLDKSFGTATLVVHTAGTHNSIVTLPGLAPDKATAIRDEIRQHIRTDFE